MPRLYLVRHAKPAAVWGEDPDPGLEAIGKQQAASAAKTLAETIAHVPILSSPLRRCRETAAPLSERWRSVIRIFPAVAEIPSPPLAAAARRDWLATAMQGTWTQLYEAASKDWTDYSIWRRSVIDALLAIPHDCVICTHYIAINVAVGAATASDRVVCFRPDHASITVLDTSREGLQIHSLGREAETSVLTGR